MKASAASLFSEALVTPMVSTHMSLPSFGTTYLIAAFSAGRPNASHPIGWTTSKPFIWK